MNSPEAQSALSIYYQNVRGLNTKATDLLISSTWMKYDIFALTETWLNSGVTDGEIVDLNNFSVFRADRNFEETSKSRGGGVLIAARNNLQVSRVNIRSLVEDFGRLINIDVVIVKCRDATGTFLYIVLVYIPPKISIDEYLLLLESLMSLDCLSNSKMIILGDFNVPEFWQCSRSNSVCNKKVVPLLNLLNYFELTQYNEILNSKGLILDLVMSCQILEVSVPEITVTKVDHYHPPLEINCSTTKIRYVPMGTNSGLIYNFRLADLITLYNDISRLDFSFLSKIKDPNIAVNQMYAKLQPLFANSVPVKRRRSGKYPIWYNNTIILSLKRKYQFWQSYKRTKSIFDLENFKSLRATVKLLIKNAYYSYVKSVSNNIKSDPKAFWAFFKAKNRQTTITSTMTRDNNIFETPQQIVNEFANFFTEVFTHNSPNVNNVCDFNPSEISVNTMHPFQVSEREVEKSLKKLKSSMTAGPDLVPSFLLRDCATVFAKPLSIIYNMILKTCRFPLLWKLSRVSPIYKAGDRSEISNYRPVSIMNNFAKVFEYVLHPIIYSHVSHLLSTKQHGFMKGRSTVTNLTVFSQFVSEVLDRGGQVDCIYNDFSKAFDRINHSLLLVKLRKFGISDSLITLISSYLTDRHLYVTYNGFESHRYIQVSGVPQGSVLGPLLFNMFVDDIAHEVMNNCLLFADDVKIFTEIKNSTDCRMLQNKLDRINSWCSENLLPLNIKKCTIMSFSRKNITNIKFDYYLENTVIERKYVVRDLGVIFDSKFTFVDHINTIILSASKSVGVIIRNSKEIEDLSVIKTLYCSLVRSRLEYASVIWNPIYKIHETNLERVQRRFLKYMVFRADGAYPEQGYPEDIMLERFSLHSLMSRRKLDSILLLVKILRFQIDCSELLSLLRFRTSIGRLRSNNLFELTVPRTKVLLASPLFQSIKNYTHVADQFDIFSSTLQHIKHQIG